MTTYILLILLLVLLVSLAILVTSHRHKRISSEIIRRLDEHHQTSLSNIEFMIGQTEKIKHEAADIKQFFEGLRNTSSTSDDIDAFVKTGKFKT